MADDQTARSARSAADCLDTGGIAGAVRCGDVRARKDSRDSRRLVVASLPRLRLVNCRAADCGPVAPLAELRFAIGRRRDPGQRPQGAEKGWNLSLVARSRAAHRTDEDAAARACFSVAVQRGAVLSQLRADTGARRPAQRPETQNALP